MAHKVRFADRRVGQRRHLEGMMAERGIDVDHSTVHRWAVKLFPVHYLRAS
jgi:transposase-like protein